MAQTTSTSKAAAESTPGTAAASEPTADSRPTVYEKKKKKKKYSRGLKEPQKLGEGLSRSAERLAQAVADGLSETRRRGNKSARKKRDGLIKDAVRNVGRGLEEAISKASKAPTDLTKRVSTRRLTRLVVPPPLNSFLK
jgi:hypothetical protein